MANAAISVEMRGKKFRAVNRRGIDAGGVAKSETDGVAALREKLGVTQRVMALLLGVTERTLNTLESGGEISASVQRRVTEIARLYAELATVVKPAAIGKWLTKPNPVFEGQTAVDLIGGGKIDLLWKMIFMLRSGASS